MSTSRPFALVQGGDAWLRAAHRDTALDLESGVVELDWTTPEPPASGAAQVAAGMAFDSGCRLYRSDPAAGQVERTLWGMGRGAPDPVELFEPEPEAPAGDFTPAAPAGGPLHAPRGLAVDEDDRLYVAESGAGRVLVFDLWSRRLLRTVPTGAGTRPLDLAAHGRVVLAAVEGLPHLLRLGARDDLRPLPLPPEAPAPERVAVSPAGAVAVLVAAGTADATVVHVDRPRDVLHLAWAGDLEWESEDTLVVARRPGENLLRFRFTHGAVEELRPLAARGYDGMGIVRTPDGRIGFHTAGGLRTAPVARVRYLQNGTVTTFRLDSGEYQTQWGRIFLDACIPSGTSVRVACLTTDEELEGQKLQRGAPGGLVTATPRRPELSPPMPPLSLLPEAPEWRPLHRRETGRELAWVQPERGDAFVTYEAPVLAEPGRYLWVALELRGTSAVSPRFRSLRVEHPGHDLLRRLPRTFAREAPDADFLRRYLALFDGLLHELESRAAARDLLLDPHATPEDMLPWLASFLGLTLDERWPVHSRRTLVSEAAWLFRFRGTVAGLRRFLEIYLEQPVVILEQFRLRGMGGAIVGERGPVESRAVLGAGFRVGGAIGDPQQAPLSGTPQDAFETHAHRFSVLVRGALTQEQLDVVQHVLDVHRPAHTLVEVCTVGTGMRVGRGLHLGISSAVGRTGGFSTLQLGAAALGRGGIMGRPEAGTLPGASRLGSDTRVG